MGDIGEPQRHFEVLPGWPGHAEPQQEPVPVRVPELPAEPSQPGQSPSEPVR
jgi:hypothetical protein